MNAMADGVAWAPPETTRRSRGALPVLLLLTVACLVIAVGTGPTGARQSPAEVARVLIDHIPLLRALPHSVPDPVADALVWQYKLPRALSALMVGALLGLAGVALQGLLMNPLADPYTVGASAGAAVGAAAAEVLGFGALWLGYAQAGAAFAAAIAAVAIVYALARLSGRVSVHTFLLAGVVVSTLLWSLIPLLLVLAGRGQDLARIMFYLLGSLQGAADWTRCLLLAPILLIVIVCLRIWARELNLMTLGEESAVHLGVEVEGFKRRVLLIGALATAASVAVAGIIGFVGLVVPHLARRLVGPDHRALAPLAAVFGAALLLASDTLCRVALNEQVPVGVITSLVGAPAFCYLLRKRQSTTW